MLTLYRPQRDLWPFRRPFDNWLDLSWQEQAQQEFRPAVDIKETKDTFLLEVDLPGASQKDVTIEVEDGVLTLSGQREEDNNEEGEGFTRRERVHGRFTRSFRLGRYVDESSISASFDRGVLTVTVPKAEAAKPKQIPISVH